MRDPFGDQAGSAFSPEAVTPVRPVPSAPTTSISALPSRIVIIAILPLFCAVAPATPASISTAPVRARSETRSLIGITVGEVANRPLIQLLSSYEHGCSIPRRSDPAHWRARWVLSEV